MTTTTETIDHSTLSKLVEANAVRAAHVVGQHGGWALMVKYGASERCLATQRGHKTRLFRRLETLVAYLKDIGLHRFDVDAAGFDPRAVRATRPDRAEALKKAHEAAAYDAWFRQQVQEAIDDPSPSIPGEIVEAEFAAMRQASLERERARAAATES
jgi:hypothetical protein